MTRRHSFAKKLLGLLLESAPVAWFFGRLWLLKNRHRIPRFTTRPTRPRELAIEVTNICNANCVFCGYQFQNRRKIVMPFNLFKQVVDEYSEIGGGSLCLTPVVGDPLIDQTLEGKVCYARSLPKITKIAFFTNGILLTCSRFEALVAAGVTDIAISISGLNQEEYERVYRVNAYQTVIANLVSIAESPAFRRVEFFLGIRPATLSAWRRSPDLARLRALGYINFKATMLLDNWSGRISTATLPGSMMVRPSLRKNKPCSMLYCSNTVLADGRMTACGCRDLDGTSDLALGSIQEQSLETPWKDGRMETLRQRFRDGNPPDICCDCRHYVPAEEIPAEHAK